MAKGAYVEIKGLKALKKKLIDIPDRVVEEVEPIMYEAANDFANRAIADAPRDQGILIQEISSYQEGKLKFAVVSGAEWSAFIEWGTRSRVQVPADLQAYAAQFKALRLGGKEVKRKIFEWCKRVGIPEEFWYPTFIAIMTKGIHPHPFFFKQREPVYKKLVADLKPALKKALNK